MNFRKGAGGGVNSSSTSCTYLHLYELFYKISDWKFIIFSVAHLYLYFFEEHIKKMRTAQHTLGSLNQLCKTATDKWPCLLKEMRVLSSLVKNKQTPKIPWARIVVLWWKSIFESILEEKCRTGLFSRSLNLMWWHTWKWVTDRKYVLVVVHPNNNLMSYH